jgi:hypothetical protein
MLIALRALIDEASKEIDVFEATQSEGRRWTIGDFMLMPTRGTRHSKPHRDCWLVWPEPPSSTKICKNEQSMRQLLADEISNPAIGVAISPSELE